MSYDYGYGALGNKLIKSFRSWPPDFVAAEKLIKEGADINATGKSDDENILSEILLGFHEIAHDDLCGDSCAACDEQNCNHCKHIRKSSIKPGEVMCDIIRFFLDHGFDVNKFNGCYGAQCLFSLTLSTYDKYMIEATKLLLDAGARDRIVSLSSTDENETPWNFIATEGSFQDCCENDHAAANIFEAVYQLYQAIEDGKPYDGIDSYESAIGKKIVKVLAECDGKNPTFFSLDLPKFKKENCFTQTLYFIYESGVLIATSYSDFWTNTDLPDCDLVDVSEHFDGIVGNIIRDFTFDHRSVVKGMTHYGQAITTIEMNNGRKVRFSTNFGEVAKKNRAAYFEILLDERIPSGL